MLGTVLWTCLGRRGLTVECLGRRGLGLSLDGRGLNLWGLGLGREGICTVLLSFQLNGREFGAVAEQFANQGALRLDGLSLLDNQHGHEAIGDQKQDGQHRQPAAFLGSSRSLDHGYGGYGISSKKSRQMSPQCSAPELAGALRIAPREPTFEIKP